MEGQQGQGEDVAVPQQAESALKKPQSEARAEARADAKAEAAEITREVVVSRARNREARTAAFAVSEVALC